MNETEKDKIVIDCNKLQEKVIEIESKKNKHNENKIKLFNSEAKGKLDIF